MLWVQTTLYQRHLSNAPHTHINTHTYACTYFHIGHFRQNIGFFLREYRDVLLRHQCTCILRIVFETSLRRATLTASKLDCNCHARESARERESVREREPKTVCVCVCVRERESEREREKEDERDREVSKAECNCAKRALYSVKRAVYSIKRAPYSIKRIQALFSIRGSLFTIRRALFRICRTAPSRILLVRKCQIPFIIQIFIYKTLFRI